MDEPGADLYVLSCCLSLVKVIESTLYRRMFWHGFGTRIITRRFQLCFGSMAICCNTRAWTSQRLLPRVSHSRVTCWRAQKRACLEAVSGLRMRLRRSQLPWERFSDVGAGLPAVEPPIPVVESSPWLSFFEVESEFPWGPEEGKRLYIRHEEH